MISIDVLSCPGQLRHICPRWLKLENLPKISQCTPVKFHNIRNKQEAILITPPKKSLKRVFVFFPKFIKQWLFIKHNTSNPNQNLRVHNLIGTWYASWASRVAVSILKIMSFTCEGNQRRNRHTRTNRPSTCWLANTCTKYDKGKPPAPTFWMKNLAKSCLSTSFQAICIHFFV